MTYTEIPNHVSKFNDISFNEAVIAHYKSSIKADQERIIELKREILDKREKLKDAVLSLSTKKRKRENKTTKTSPKEENHQHNIFISKTK